MNQQERQEMAAYVRRGVANNPGAEDMNAYDLADASDYLVGIVEQLDDAYMEVFRNIASQFASWAVEDPISAPGLMSAAWALGQYADGVRPEREEA